MLGSEKDIIKLLCLIKKWIHGLFFISPSPQQLNQTAFALQRFLFIIWITRAYLPGLFGNLGAFHLLMIVETVIRGRAKITVNRKLVTSKGQILYN